MSDFPPEYREDHHPPFRRRVYLPEFSGLNPLSLPWKELRRSPENYPAWHIAKVSGVRTVVGFSFKLPSGDSERIYLKRSLLRDPIKKLLSRFRASKEWREFHLAIKFQDAGVRVPKPVYYAETVGGGEPTVFYATRALGGAWKSATEHFEQTREFGRDWLDLARYTRELHNRQFLHGDYRGDHVFLNKALFEKNEEAWALIDLDGSAVGRPVSSHDRRRALCQLAESLLAAGIGEEKMAEFLGVYDPEQKHGLDAADIIATAERKQSK